MIEDTIAAVKDAEEKARQTASDAREKVKEIEKSTGVEVDAVFEDAKKADREYYDKAMSDAKAKGEQILSDAESKANDEKEKIKDAAGTLVSSVVEAVISALA